LKQEEVETDSRTAWMRVRTPSPELTYSRMSGAITPSPVFMLVPTMVPPQKHEGQQQQQHTPHQARQLVWMVPVPYPGVASASNPFLNVAPPNGAGMQYFVPEVGTPVASNVNAEAASDAETEVMLSPSSVQKDMLTKQINVHQQTVSDKVSQADDISKTEQENEEDEFGPPISLGSVGHPNNCAKPCKYTKKQRGCKDGDQCTHCHLCVWRSHRRSRAKT